MKRVFITGVSGYIGNRLAVALAKNEKVERLVGLDIVAPAIPVEKLTFLNQDIRVSLAQVLMQHRIDTVIHTAWVVKQIHNASLMEEMNLDGTRNVMTSCKAAGVKHLIYTSSTTAYGFHSDNDYPLTEKSPLRGNEGFTYAKNKKEVEHLLNAYVMDNRNIKVSVLRPCFVVGPGFKNDMSDYLTSNKFFLPPKTLMLPWKTSPMQFIHEDDVVNAILHCMDTGAEGVFNLAGDGLLSFEEIAAMQGHWTLHIPDPLFNGLNKLLLMSGLSTFQIAAFDMLRFAWVASRDKFVNQTGFSYQYDTRSAFADFVSSTRRSTR